MGLYEFLVNAYNQFISVFPAPLQWVVTLLILIGLIGAFISLFRGNWIALVVVILLLPFLVPVLQHFFTDLYNFFQYLLQTLRLTAPSGP